MAARTEHIEIDGLTLPQGKAIAKAALSTLERDSVAHCTDRALTAQEARAAHDGLEKLLRAIEWHRE